MAESRYTCQVCGHRWHGGDNEPQSCERCARAPLTRDSLLARLADVLRRSGVEDADSLVTEVERRMPTAEPKPGEVPMWARPIGHPLGTNVSVMVDGVDVTSAFTSTEFPVPDDD